jgi:hypothetical protein
MVKKLTITVSDEVYRGLHEKIGARRISAFIDQLARPHVSTAAAEALYREAAADAARERDVAEWDAIPADEALPDEDWAPKRKRKA